MTSFIRNRSVRPEWSDAPQLTARDQLVADSVQPGLILRAITDISILGEGRPSAKTVASRFEELVVELGSNPALDVWTKVGLVLETYFRQFYRPGWTFRQPPGGMGSGVCSHIWEKKGVREAEGIWLLPALDYIPSRVAKQAFDVDRQLKRAFDDSYGGMRLVFLSAPSQLLTLDAGAKRFDQTVAGPETCPSSTTSAPVCL